MPPEPQDTPRTHPTESALDPQPALDQLGRSRAPKAGGRRPWWVAILVLLVGAFVLARMWPDLRFWLSAGDPQDVAITADLRAHENMYVHLRGTPDVGVPGRLSSGDRSYRVFRIREQGVGLFAVVPSAGAVADTSVPTEFLGRLRRLRDVGAGAGIREFFEREEQPLSVPVELQALRAVWQPEHAAESIQVGVYTVPLAAGTQFELVIKQPEAVFQLGKDSFPREEDVRKAMDALQVPYAIGASERLNFYKVVALVPEQAQEQARTTLLQWAVKNDEAEADQANPRRGVLILPRTTTVELQGSELQRSMTQEKVTIKTTAENAGDFYEIADGKLAAMQPGANFPLPWGRVQSIHARVPVKVPEDAHVILVGTKPEDAWQGAAVAGLALLLMLVNGVLVLFDLRRRRAMQ